MKEQPNLDITGAKKALVDALSHGLKKARFLTELAATLARSDISKEQMENALAELETAGVVMVRDHFCADPHLVGVDLRVVALVESIDGVDAQLHAIQQIDNTWGKWLGEYLANHRCG